MRSRADRVRRTIEVVLRAIALVALAVLLWRLAHPPAAVRVDTVRGHLDDALARWTHRAPASAHLVLDTAPDPVTRDWARAIARAGSSVRWSSARPIEPSAIVSEPTPEPYEATRLRITHGDSVPVLVRDGAGLIDSLPPGETAELVLASVAGPVRASSPASTAVTVPVDSVLRRSVLVLGAAEWESKFIIAALEERGWEVAARLRVAPTVEVTQGTLGAIDTARYAAVIVVDSTPASQAAAIARYARAGGGVVLAGTAARLAPLAGIAPGGVGTRRAGVAGAIASRDPRAGLGAFFVSPRRPDAVVLESRGDAPVVAARRVDAGRVLQTGYDETWRWRMAGDEGAVAGHREWWSRLVAAVAYAPVVRRPLPSGAIIDETPLASLVDALGPPAPLEDVATPQADPSRVSTILFALTLAALLMEWASRRLRGAR